MSTPFLGHRHECPRRSSLYTLRSRWSRGPLPGSLMHRRRPRLSLSRVGVTNVEKVIRIGPRGAEQLYYAKLDCFVELGPQQRGAHMSRFDEVVNDVIGNVVLGESGLKAEQLAQRV